jgi:hypothetical protein
MAKRTDTYALLLPFSVQDLPTGAPAGLDSSGPVVEVTTSPEGGTQRPRRLVMGIAAVSSAVFLAVVFLATANTSPRRGMPEAQPAATVRLFRATWRIMADDEKPKGDSDCHTATKGEACHTHVVWAMNDRDNHPERYEGLSKESTFADFQAFLHGQVLDSGARRCPTPCATDLSFARKGHEARGNRSAGATRTKKECHTAIAGEECYNRIMHTKKEAMKYPKWYPGISEESRLVDVQRYLKEENVCPEPCEIVEEEGDSGASLTENSAEDCHTALPGETCYSDILSAIDNIAQHPEWYPGLTNYSSKAHFQAFLNAQSSDSKCPAPCDTVAFEEVWIRDTCKTASERGEACYESIRWGSTVGIRKHPEWYPNLTEHSSAEEFQLHLHADPKTKCPKRPCACHTHVEGEPCFDSVMWIKEVGLHRHPGSFKGLSNTSSFEEIQAHLHAERTTPCLRPCARLPW